MHGVSTDEFRVTSHLYRNRVMAATSVILMKGRVDGRDNTNEPVSWTNGRKGQRVFYTSLGNVDDFHLPAFRQMLLNAVCWALDRPVPEKAQRARPKSGS